MISVTIPMRLPSASNLREHWSARARRVKAQRAATTLMLKASQRDYFWEYFDWFHLDTATVALIRVAPRKLDDDNLRGAFKAVRDSVAAYFGVDDADPRIEWRYGQEKGEACVRIEIDVR